MNNRQIKQVRMFVRVRTFFSINSILLMAFLPLGLLITDFLLLFKNLESEIGIQDEDNKGVAKGKNDLRALMIALTVPLSRKARVWAKAAKNSKLATQFDIHKTSFGISELEDLTLGTNIMGILNLNATELVAYNITALQLTELGTVVAAFKKELETPELATTEAKTSTENIATGITKIMEQLVDIDDLLIPEFEITDAAIVASYKENRIIGEAAVQHTTLTTHTYADDAHTIPLNGANMSIVELNRSCTSDVDGMAEIVQFKDGSYNLRIVSAGKADMILPFNIKRGKHVEMNIVMVPNKIRGTILTASRKPATNCKVLIQGTTIEVVPDDFGNFILLNIPDGNGVIEATNTDGLSVSLPFVMVNGRELVINLVLG